MRMINAINEIYRNRKQFIVVGLTGKTGSGCTTVANALGKEYKELKLSHIDLEKGGNNHERKMKIVQTFAERNWQPFFRIQVRDVISTYLLECKFDELHGYFMNTRGIDLSPIRESFESYYVRNKCLDEILIDNYKKANNKEIYDYIKNHLPRFTSLIKDFLDNKTQDKFFPVYQTLGDNIRKHGDVIERVEVITENIYSIARRINSLIKVLRDYNEEAGLRDYFVIDAFRNPLEVKFFQERYSAFYLMAINCQDEDRKDRLKNVGISKEKIEQIDEKEGKHNILDSYDYFLSQDINSCILLADIYVNNHGKFEKGSDNYPQLNNQLVRYISLIQHPGLITPSRDEKLMQIAFTAKLSSGCISRQVGAVVTNKDYSPKAIGWNSSPEEQTPCLLRNVDYLLDGFDSESYSQYERESDEVKIVAEDYRKRLKNNTRPAGLGNYYCFKTFQNKIDNEKNQVHTRALHAEENAFLQLAKYGSEAIKGGKLYTTASPCELCSKKAYQLGIKEIVYIEAYPGIAFDHIIKVGKLDSMPGMRLFAGAIGSAYHKLYLPIIPIKDEINAYLDEEIDPQKTIKVTISKDLLGAIDRIAKETGCKRDQLIMDMLSESITDMLKN